MKHRFGFWTLSFLVIANMIGAGVFTTSGFSLADLGSPSVVVLAWIAGGLIALAGAVSYGMLIGTMPESGGEYLFLSRAAHPMLGFIAGWVSLIAGFSGAIAFAATAFEEYIRPDLARLDIPIVGSLAQLPSGTIAIASILVAGAIHGLRPSFGAVVQNTVVVTKLLLLLTVIAVASFALRDVELLERVSVKSVTFDSKLLFAFAGSLVWISLSYSGFNAAVYIASEVEGAESKVPSSLVAGTSIVVILYVLLNAAFVFSGPTETIAGTKDVAAVAAQQLAGPRFEHFVRWTIAICLLTSVTSMIMAAPRVYSKMADDGMLPAFLKFDGASPMRATVAQVVMAITLVLISSLQDLLSYLSLTLSLSAACSVCCLFLPKVRLRPLSHPLHLIPLFYVVCTIGAAAIMTTSNPLNLLGTVLTFLVGAIAYLIMKASSNGTQKTSSDKSQ